MRITKSRLLEIIREEVELHENKLQENTFIFEETDLTADKNGDGEISDREGGEAINKEIKADEAAGNIKEADVEEDRLFGPKDRKGNRRIVAEPNGRDRLEIKIR